jgi:hypothetical protein
MIDPKDMTTLDIDEASAKILGHNGCRRKDGFYYIERKKVKGMLRKWNPTGDITQAWPLILDNHIDIIAPRAYVDNLWQCQIIENKLDGKMYWTKGDDPLVEAMRVFVMKNIDKIGESK